MVLPDMGRAPAVLARCLLAITKSCLLPALWGTHDQTIIHWRTFTFVSAQYLSGEEDE